MADSSRQLLYYRLVEEIGKGGMGVVWKAVDTNLDREVAIKVLPDHLATDQDRLARFKREAQLLASLNHPNVATVFGVHDAEGTRFLAMELVPGEDLAERLKKGPLPVAESLSIARQIAEGLEAAHRRGVIHRDLKPANVRITADGVAKLLDFGLAKAKTPRTDASITSSPPPTVSMNETAAGVLLGTVAYMSPEQARGHDLDERSDIWSFGCVLWECLTGERLFEAATMSDSIGAILHSEPDLRRLPVDIPASVRRLLRRCLAKDPSERLHHIADARLELDEPDPTPPTEGQTARRHTIAVVVLTILLLVILTVALLSLVWPRPGRSDSRRDNPLADAKFTKLTDFPGSEFDAAISPDGKHVAFVSDREATFKIYLGKIGTGEFSALLPDLDEFAGPDSLASGSAMYPSSDVPLVNTVRGVGFNHNGSELWFGGGVLQRMRAALLSGRRTVRDFLESNVVDIAWSHDGKRTVYHTNDDGDPVYVADQDGKNGQMVLGSSKGMHQHFPAWSVDDQWIYLVRGRQTTFDMDLWRVHPNGDDPQQLTRRKLDVRYPTPIDERTVLYSARDEDGAGPWLWAIDVETRISRRATVGLQQYTSVAASADHDRLVATVQNPQASIWSVPIHDAGVATESDVKPFAGVPTARARAPRFGSTLTADGGRMEQLFFLSSGGGGDGLWQLSKRKIQEIWPASRGALFGPVAVSPDGRWVVLLLRKNDGWRVHRLSVDGLVDKGIVSESVDARGSAAWSPDGQWIVTEGSVNGVRGLYKIHVDDAHSEPELLVGGEALNPIWSPDGTMIIYAGPQANANSQLLAVDADGTPIELPQIEVWRAGERARFLPDGTGLVYMQRQHSSQDFWRLDIATMKSRRLTQLDPPATIRTFDITPDGEKIVFDRLTLDSDIVLIELPQAE